MSDIISVTDTTFETEVLHADLPVVVDFWAEWCGPCKQMGPVFEELATAMDGKVKFVKMDVDNNTHTPTKYGIRGIPTFILFKDSNLINNKVGANTKEVLETWINEHI